MTGAGKTHFAKAQLAGAPRVLALDVNDEYSQHGRRAGPLFERATASTLAKHPTKLLESNLSLSVVPDKPTPQSRATALRFILRSLETIAEHRQSKPLVLVLDELGEYVEHAIEAARSLATRGLTHLSASLLVVTQRPFLIPKTVRSQMAELHIFRLEEVDDAEAATERFPDRKAAALEVQALPPRRYISKRPTLPTSAELPRSPLSGEANA